jgi:DNA-binding NtrC family response regulator
VDIFVVDDERIIAETTVGILKHNGYSAIAFDNPHDALAAVSERRPKLLIADGASSAIRTRPRSFVPTHKMLLTSW